jgi:Fe-S-cluster containining protein
MAETGETPDIAYANLEMKIGDYKLETHLPMPAGPALWRETLPGWRVLMEGLTSVAIAQAGDQGRKLSCKAGCGACCRQLVPIAPSEAHQLARLVAGLTEPRRAVVQERFAAARATIEQAGLRDRLTNMAAAARGPEATRLSLAYFALNIACPFLEAESCTIYPERPLVCREYLVSSDPVHCADPAQERIEQIEFHAHLATVFAIAEGEGTLNYLALSTLLDWVAEHPESGVRYETAAMVGEVLGRLIKGPVPKDGGVP